MSTSQDQTRVQLHEWTATETANVRSMQPTATYPPSIDPRLQERQSRYEHVIGYDPDQRLLAANDTIDEVRDWNSGRGHLIVTAPGLPVSALNSLALLGFPPAEIEAAIVERIDENGNLTTEDIVAATAELTGVPGTEDAFLQTIHDRATSPEALDYAENSAYYDERLRVEDLPLPDLIAETGEPDLDTARHSMAERHGYATYDDLDAVLMKDDWDASSHQLYSSLTPTELALWEAHDVDIDAAGDSLTVAEVDQAELSAASPEFEQASGQDAAHFAEQAGDVDEL
jgi:hypothetical protein